MPDRSSRPTERAWCSSGKATCTRAPGSDDRIEAEEERLLAAIRDAPADDDQPRLVYADWLLERGEPRGELISTQCALARMAPGDPDRERLEDRVRALVEEHRERWCGGIEGIEEGGFTRGFIDPWWTIAASAVVNHADRLWRLLPFPSIELHETEGLMPRLAACPALARYRALVFWETDLEAEDLARLADCPHLAELEVLGLDYCHIYDDAMIALSRSTQLASLSVLRVSGNNNGFELPGVRALAEAVFAPHLESLSLSRRWLDEQLADAIAAFPALCNLSLHENRLGDAGAARLAALPLRLLSLDLHFNDIRDAGALALAGSPILDEAQFLDLSSNPIGEASGVELVESGRLGALRNLSFGGWDGIAKAPLARAIARSLPRLERLDLSSARIGPDGAEALAAGDLARLHSLELRGNQLGDAGAIALARSTTLPALHWLDLRDNGITDAGALALAESPHLSSLKRLSLESAPLGPKALDALRARFGASWQ